MIKDNEVVAYIRDKLVQEIIPDITTNKLDDIAIELLEKAGVISLSKYR